MEQSNEIRDPVSLVEDNGVVLDSVYEGDHDQFQPFVGSGMVRLVDGEADHERVKKAFLVPLDHYGNDTTIVAIHRNSVSGTAMRARYNMFRYFEKTLSQKNAGSVNLKNSWYGASKEEISEILSYGFNRCSGPIGGDVSNGLGLYLSSSPALLNCVTSLTPDEHGLRHVLMCSVLMGKMEAIPAGSNQIHASSMEFDSGVDHLEAPTRYIVWVANMNSHVLPCYIISFKGPDFYAWATNQLVNVQRLSSPKLSLNSLMAVVLKHFNPAKKALMRKRLDDYRKGKITRSQVLRSLWQIVGSDARLVEAIKSIRVKKMMMGPSTCGGWSNLRY
ncbi:hypothetical protein Tsubulata_026104 [Turnera subulata]|uniref:PARP catalytic domain-containing protein n=1 Tax=Turnera subulata TaxID=218843 RepID=A0A9Q0G6U7_9ROSI|nr:hypothetical protein Tsubulata_026104 [Turnera subulata]